MADHISVSEALNATENLLFFLAEYQPNNDLPIKLETLLDRPETKHLFHVLQNLPMDNDICTPVTNRLLNGFSQVPNPLAAGLIAVQVGILVEKGMDPVPLAQALLARLPTDFAAARQFVRLMETEGAYKYPDKADTATIVRLSHKEIMGASAWVALKVYTMAAMTAWCRHRPSRLMAQTIPEFTENTLFLGSRKSYCWYLGELLSSADGIQLTVLAPEQRKGFLVELEAVRNAAHLFALLEDTVVGDPTQGLLIGPRMDPQVAMIARGEAMIKEALSVTIGWHYEYWWGLAPDVFAQSLNLHPLVAAMIGVEVSVHNLPQFHNQGVILMRPGKLKQRGCDINFFAPLHDALRSRVTILQHLSPEEVDTLCEALRSEAQRLS